MQAMDHLAESPTVKIRVNPEEYDFVSRYWTETRGSSYRDRTWEVIADTEVTRGGCVLELESGRIDAQLETQLAEVSKALRLAGGFSDRAA
jgi:type III secretion protein L